MTPPPLSTKPLHNKSKKSSNKPLNPTSHSNPLSKLYKDNHLQKTNLLSLLSKLTPLLMSTSSSPTGKTWPTWSTHRITFNAKMAIWKSKWVKSCSKSKSCTTWTYKNWAMPKSLISGNSISEATSTPSLSKATATLKTTSAKTPASVTTCWPPDGSKNVCFGLF